MLNLLNKKDISTHIPMSPSIEVVASSRDGLLFAMSILLTLAQSSTNLLLTYGGKEAAIILAIAALILAIAQLIKVLVPVMMRQPDAKEQ